MSLKTLIFSVSIGAGHDSVAKAIAQEIKAKSTDSDIIIVDTFKYINPILNKVVVGSYMETIKFTPKVWGYLYTQAEEGDRLVDIGQILSKLLSPKLEKLLRDFNPDVLVCTHAFPVGILSKLKETKNINIPLVACITDFTVHQFWVHPKVDLYIVPQEDLVYPLLKAEVDPNRIKVHGIPIRKQFSETYSQEEIRKSLGLEISKKTLLIMGGGLGLGQIEKIVKELLEETELQILVVTGSNEKLKKNLSLLKGNNSLHVFGFAENVAELMAAADILITKPGGVTTAEALAMELPIVIISPLPGQEDRNTEYLLNKGVGIRVRNEEYLINEIYSLCQNPLRIKHMKEMAAQLKRPKAAYETAKAIFELSMH